MKYQFTLINKYNNSAMYLTYYSWNDWKRDCQLYNEYTVVGMRRIYE